MNHKQFLRILGIATLTLVVGAALVGAMSLSSPPRLRGVYLTSVAGYSSLHDLTEASAVVARIKVMQVGHSYRLPDDPPVVVVASPPAGKALGLTPIPTPIIRVLPVPTPVDPGLLKKRTERLNELLDTGTLKTDSMVEVLETIKGSDLEKGEHLTVAQLGGIDEHGNPVLAEDDPVLLQEDEQDIMFLKHDPKSGKFFTTGGGQGRFAVTDKDTVRAIAPQSPVGRAHNGESVDAFTAAIKAADRPQDAIPTPTPSGDLRPIP